MRIGGLRITFCDCKMEGCRRMENDVHAWAKRAQKRYKHEEFQMQNLAMDLKK